MILQLVSANDRLAVVMLREHQVMTASGSQEQLLRRARLERIFRCHNLTRHNASKSQRLLEKETKLLWINSRKASPRRHETTGVDLPTTQ